MRFNEKFPKLAIFFIWITFHIMVLIPAGTVYAAGKEVVYTSYSDSGSGDGTKENPYSRFEDAVANVADGGTIYILSSKYAFLNIQSNDLPFEIDKNVTIEPEPGASKAVLMSRSAGIILGGDVTFNNIEIDEAYKYHAQIFTNGYSLTLNAVSRGSGYRILDIVGGGLYDLQGNHIGPATGAHANITIQGKVELGNVYAGAINGTYYGDTTILIQDTKGAVVGDLYASGALEAEVDRDNWFDLEEPPAPTADADLYPVTGNVEMTLMNTSITLVEGAGAEKGTKVTFGTQYSNYNLALRNIAELVVAQGTLQPKELTVWSEEKLNVGIPQGSTLDFTKAGSMELHNLSGGGTMIVGTQDLVTIDGTVTGTTAFETSGGYNGYSGIAVTGHVYIQTASEIDGDFSFVPYQAQEGYTLEKQSNGNWIVMSSDDVAIYYYSWCDEYGTVSNDWELLDKNKGTPTGSKAVASVGCHFINWTDAEGNVVSEEEELIPQKTDGEYVNAEYFADFVLNQYQVQYDANGGAGSEMPLQEYFYGEPQKLLANTYIRQGYEFLGWNTSPDGTGSSFADEEQVNSLTTVSDGTVTLYAQWKAHSYTVVYDGNGATYGYMKSTMHIHDIAEALKVNAFLRKGYTFVGWNAEEAGTGTVYADGEQVVNLTDADGEKVHLYAMWTPTEYTISYELNGGTNSAANQTTYSSQDSTIMLKIPKREGYTFLGWYKESTFQTKVTCIPRGSKGNKTFYAKWKRL
jgi:uncharacterized repeat protein (TIGR02543 family)